MRNCLFRDLFERYLGGARVFLEKEPCNRVNDCGTGTSDKNRTVLTDAAHGSKNATLSYSHAQLHGYTVGKPGNGGAPHFPGHDEHNNTDSSDDQDDDQDDEDAYLGPPGDDPADFK